MDMVMDINIREQGLYWAWTCPAQRCGTSTSFIPTLDKARDRAANHLAWHGLPDDARKRDVFRGMGIL